MKVRRCQSNSTSLTTGDWPSLTPADSSLADAFSSWLPIGWNPEGCSLLLLLQRLKDDGRNVDTWDPLKTAQFKLSRGRLVCRSGGATITPSGCCQEMLSYCSWLFGNISKSVRCHSISVGQFCFLVTFFKRIFREIILRGLE